MNIDQINSAIIAGNLTNEDLESVIAAVKYARARIARKNATKLSVGAMVTFTNPRNGDNFEGRVEAIKIKNASVRCEGMLYRVPMNLLTAVV